MKLSENINLRCSEVDKARISASAEACGVSVTRYVLARALGEDLGEDPAKPDGRARSARRRRRSSGGRGASQQAGSGVDRDHDGAEAPASSGDRQRGSRRRTRVERHRDQLAARVADQASERQAARERSDRRAPGDLAARVEELARTMPRRNAEILARRELGR